MFEFIKKVVTNQKKDYLLLLILLTVLAAFEFCLIAMYDCIATSNYMTMLSLSSIPTLALAIAVVLSVFITKYFIQSKQQEFSMLLLFGRKPKDLFIYLILQYAILLIIAFGLGIILGLFLMYAINSLLHILQMTFSFHFDLSNNLFLYFCFLIITVILVLAVSTQQFTQIECHLSTTINHKSVQKGAPYLIAMSRHSLKRKFPITQVITSFFAIYIFFYALYALITDTLLQNKLIYFSLSLASMIIIINTFIPLLFDICHQSILQHPFLFYSISGFIDLTNQLVSIANIHAIVVPVMFMFLLMGETTSNINAFIIPCFMMMLIMLLLCLIIKFSLYLKSTFNIYATQYALGYNQKQLFKISLFKNILFIFLVIIIPLIYIHYLGSYIVMQGYLSKSIMTGLEILYIVIYFMFLILMIIKEKQCIKEVSDHVKYLNRSE